VDPLLYEAALPHKGKFTLRPRPKHRNDQLFASLAASVVGQQLSIRAADTIWGRVKTELGGRVTATTIDEATETGLRAAGLSFSKIKTLKSLAHAVLYEKLNLLALRACSYDEALARLTRIWGIGPWTVEMFLIFAQGARDVFSPGDLGLARAIESLYGLPKNTPRAELLQIASKWSPHRSFACLILWRLYEA
jgi:DNA-3-methyladenine glycosylase II